MFNNFYSVLKIVCPGPCIFLLPIITLKSFLCILFFVSFRIGTNDAGFTHVSKARG